MKKGTYRKQVIRAGWLAGVLFILPAARGVTLDECIRAALRGNPGVQEATHRVEAARQAWKQAQAAYYPRLTASGGYTRTDNAPQAFMMVLNQRALDMTQDFNHPDDTDNLRLSLGAQMRLFDGGVRGLDSKMGALGRDAATEQLQAVQNQLVYEVIRGYHAVLQAQAFTKVQQETVESLKENLRVARERFEAGSVVKTDVLNLEVRLAEAQEDLISAENGVQLAVAALNAAIGRNLVGRNKLREPQRKKLPALPEVNDTDIEERPELQATRLVEEIAEKKWKKARRAYVPKINAFGSLDWDSDVSSDFENSYFVGVMADVDLFRGFQRPHAIRQAEAERAAARAAVEDVRNKLRLDLKQATLNAREARQRLEVAHKSIESAKEALRITRERYEQGAADITELLTAQVGLTATRSRHVAAYYGYLTALANIDRARGALVQRVAKQ